MSHYTARESYRKLSERINRFPQGAPPTDLLFQILEVLFTPAEAELVALLPIKPFTAETAARLWKKSETEARNILEALASRGKFVTHGNCSGGVPRAASWQARVLPARIHPAAAHAKTLVGR